jgi:hypothetical protein
MEEHVFAAERRVGPGGIGEQGLAAEFLGNAKSLSGTQPGDALAPVRVFVLAHGAPVPGNELTNAAGNHPNSVAAGAGRRLADRSWRIAATRRANVARPCPTLVPVPQVTGEREPAPARRP